jgi:hypothetical protein
MNEANASGEPGIGSAPCASRRSRTSGAPSAFTTSVFSF